MGRTALRHNGWPIDAHGRLVVPRAIRERAGLEPGMELEHLLVAEPLPEDEAVLTQEEIEALRAELRS